ncbi:MAG: hypothetical protein IT558_05745 [Alphaproteobacteria bacterium]|nr:hypothetical protein [Alphaproteobacteria bacterium]
MRDLWPVTYILLLGLCACADNAFQPFESSRSVRASAPVFFLEDPKPTAGDFYLADEKSFYRPLTEDSPVEDTRHQSDDVAGLEPVTHIAPGCSIKDRFDRDAMLAYNFSDNQSRLSLHLSGDVGLGEAEFEKVMIKFNYKFQPGKDKKQRCRYASGFQGVVGSVYNEFVRRKHDTVLDELRDKNPLGLFE